MEWFIKKVKIISSIIRKFTKIVIYYCPIMTMKYIKEFNHTHKFRIYAVPVAHALNS